MKKASLLFILSLLIYSCKKNDQEITAIKLDKTTLSLSIDGTYLFKVSHTPESLPDPTYNWSSSNEGIAVISQKGELKAKKIGSTIITVTDNNNLKSQCVVNVIPVEASSITFNNDSH